MMALQEHGVPLFIGHFHPGGVISAVEIRAASESRFGAGGPDEFQNGLITHQGRALPIPADQTEHAMLDQIPLGSSGRIMVYGNDDPKLVCQLLKSDLPPPPSAIVGTATVCLDEEAVGLWIAASPLRNPPTAKRGVCELMRIMGSANHDITAIVTDVIDSIRNGAPLRPAWEIMVENVSSGFS